MIVKILLLILACLAYYLSPHGRDSDIQKSSGPAQADTPIVGNQYMGLVTRVADGDTLTIHTENGARQKIRMYAIDAPELKQAGGEQAKAWLNKQVMNKQVKIVVAGTDRYKRQVAKLILPVNGCTEIVCEGEVDVNLRAVEEGHAWWYRDYSRNQSKNERQRYEKAENEARANHKGLWQNPQAQAPWQWRTAQRK